MARRKFGTIKARKDRNGKIVSYTFLFPTPDGTQTRYPGVRIPQSISKTLKPWEKDKGYVWLNQNEKQIELGTWVPPQVLKEREKGATLTFDEYARGWIRGNDQNGDPRKESTMQKYEEIYLRHLEKTFGELPLQNITKERVDAWYSGFPVSEKSGESARWHAYTLLNAIMRSASSQQEDGRPPLIKSNPCVRRARRPRTKLDYVIASYDELPILYQAMPPETRLAVILGGVMALRHGEVLGLERRDVDLSDPARPVLHVRRQATSVRRGGTHRTVLSSPKTEGSSADVPIPVKYVPLFREHLAKYTESGPEGLLFHGKRHGRPLSYSALTSQWEKARQSVPRLKEAKMRFHDLRHTALTHLGQAGGTVKDVQQLGRQTTSSMALHYQHSDLKRVAEVQKEEKLPDFEKTARKSD